VAPKTEMSRFFAYDYKDRNGRDATHLQTTVKHRGGPFPWASATWRADAPSLVIDTSGPGSPSSVTREFENGQWKQTTVSTRRSKIRYLPGGTMQIEDRRTHQVRTVERKPRAAVESPNG
jgi:hypothetical protein